MEVNTMEILVDAYVANVNMACRDHCGCYVEHDIDDGGCGCDD